MGLVSVRPRRRVLSATVLAGGLLLAAPTGTAAAGAAQEAAAPAKWPTAIGTGGAIATVDPDASAAGLRVLREGGNAVDAAVAAAAALGVTEPYSAGIGGGGFFVVYSAATGRVETIDGRETAPALFRQNSFVDPATLAPLPFEEAVTSGLSVGTPGTPATWELALRRHGSRSLAQVLQPAIGLARRGFVVDPTFRDQTASNAARFADITSTRDLFLPGGAPPAVGTVFRNPDLAGTYELLAREGVEGFYGGPLAREMVTTVERPPVAPGATRVVRPGLLRAGDLTSYDAVLRDPTRVTYRGLDVYGMAPPSSGGTTVGEALQILERSQLAGLSETQALHRYLEASRLAFADRAAYVGDPGFVRVPVRELLSEGFARERACLIDPGSALTSPVAAGRPDGSYGGCAAPAAGPVLADREGLSTTHLTVADRFGNVVAYTLTIESTGGSGITVPGRGFLLNNELTDFNFVEAVPDDPNLPAPGKRPRSSMSPTIVLRDGAPVLAVGSPGGSTIITTVLQVLVGHLDRGLTLPEAIAAPRVSQRNSDPSRAEPAFLASPVADRLRALGHEFDLTPAVPPLPAELGAVAAVRVLRGGGLLAAAEPTRRGGGSALVVTPRR